MPSRAVVALGTGSLPYAWGAVSPSVECDGTSALKSSSLMSLELLVQCVSPSFAIL